MSLRVAYAAQPTCGNNCNGNGVRLTIHFALIMWFVHAMNIVFFSNRFVMKTATVIAMRDGNVQIVRKRTMVQVEASTVVTIVELLRQQL